MPLQSSSHQSTSNCAISSSATPSWSKSLTAWATWFNPTALGMGHQRRCFIAVIASATANQVIHAVPVPLSSVQLMAWSKGLGCCWLGSIQRDKLKILLELPNDKQVLYLVSVGYQTKNRFRRCPADKSVSTTSM